MSWPDGDRLSLVGLDVWLPGNVGADGVEASLSEKDPLVADDARLTRIDAPSRTVTWCMNVANPFRVKKKRYWMITGAFERGVEAKEDDFSICAQVRYTSNKRSKIPSRTMER